jgi:hypothetical protein
MDVLVDVTEVGVGGSCFVGCSGLATVDIGLLGVVDMVILMILGIE